jgi:hypothetical protein
MYLSTLNQDDSEHSTSLAVRGGARDGSWMLDEW